MKTIKQCKDEVAKSKGYTSWSDMTEWFTRIGQTPTNAAQLMEISMTEAFTLYIQSL